MKMPASIGRHSRQNNAAPSSAAVKNPFCPAKIFHNVKGDARTRGIAAAEVEKDFFRSVRPSSLLQRFAKIEEVAALVAFVSSPLSAATNGAALRADGGVLRSIL